MSLGIRHPITMEIKEQNLLSATEDYIVQQNCCTGCRPHGLSQVLVTAFPYANPYCNRKPMKKGGNTAIEQDRDTPGTVKILGNGIEQRYVACLFAQFAMGKPGNYNSFGIPDSAKDREKYFAECLECLANQIPPTASVAFPYKIGCGLAGGNWSRYENILREWISRHPKLRCVIYKID